jgi:hypothetical protein
VGIWKSEWKPLLLLAAVFGAALYLPVGHPRFDGGVTEALHRPAAPKPLAYGRA